MEFYTRRNGSKTYSLKLFQRINKELKFLIKQPELGIKSEIEFVRGLIIEDYILFYEFDNEKIIVHTLWDCKQNPEDLRIK
jgi:hypothetical protein